MAGGGVVSGNPLPGAGGLQGSPQTDRRAPGTACAPRETGGARRSGCPSSSLQLRALDPCPSLRPRTFKAGAWAAPRTLR